MLVQFLDYIKDVPALYLLVILQLYINTQIGLFYVKKKKEGDVTGAEYTILHETK